MLPLRISLQGFMSYRDATTFDFEGARLWMLAGENGAGKSTVFDALRFALFGVHRGGKIKPEQLIHHESQKLMVEVELRLGEQLYKLRRTLGREGVRPTWDVSRRAEGAWESVAGTSMAREYERWVEDHIGLTDEAFCASVYLSQGRADAILNADADARYELLSQLVDLEVYERWSQRADERRISARADMLEARKRWETAPSPAPERLSELRERGEQLETRRAELEEQARQLESARTDATRWEEWTVRLGDLEREAAVQRALLEDEARIERDFARLQHLTQHNSVIESFWQNLKRREELAPRIADLLAQQATAQQGLDEAQVHENTVSQSLEEANRTWTQASDEWGARVQQSAQLKVQRAAIERRAQLLSQRAQNQEKAATFEAGLDERLERAQAEQAQAREATRSLPLWHRFVAARQVYLTAQAQKQSGQKRLDEKTIARDELASTTQQAQAQQEVAAEGLRAAVGERSRLTERAEALETRRADFAQVEGEARCHFCGQELSPEHRAAELERLATATLALETEQAQVQSAYETALTAFREAQKNTELAVKARDTAERAVTDADIQLRQYKNDIARERTLGQLAWDELGTTARAAFGFSEISFDDGFAQNTARPNAYDFKHLEQTSQSASSLEADIARWQGRISEREQIQTELARLNAELVPLLAQWSDAAVEEWQTSAAQLTAELQTAKERLDETQTQVKKAREEQARASRSTNEARSLTDELVRQLGPLQGELKAVENALASSQPAFNKVTESELSTLSEVSTLRDAWTRETKELEASNTIARHQAMGKARDQLAHIERDHAFYHRQIAALPVVAQRPRAAVETEWEEARTQLKSTEAERAHIGDEVRRLEREQDERANLEKQLHDRSLQHDRWEELARLLGPHQLQRHLLRQAEAAIVREANAVLESISGGTLRLELVPDSDENTSGNRRPKVLDVVCYHLSGSEELKPIAPAFLSGSQRFRVAVALALGIGRTAARGSSGNGRGSRVETILIDEGFGALDKTGRDEMKDELRELGRELGRVILVSHQEDFARAFPNRFNIALENGVSRVQKVVE